MSTWQGSFLRFLVSGAGNTAATYAIYLLLLTVLPYRISYTIAYASGILIAYILYRFYVFRAHGGKHGLVLVAAIYLVQYLAGLGMVQVWVELLGGSARIAPLASIVALLPFTYLLNRLVFRRESEKRPAP